ncbi:MAG: glycosyl transferase [Oceanicaulis sp.]|uniref:glycosyltransferase family 2 protein n=1 Tax=Oceanicaulis sp. UBA2681 TaxID=1947007 RepID=UPI000C0B4A7E|nr:glycosyltransferase family 2 protein [Oceanicaulis sp. UBA2681]MAP49151.1 glycosyl transferase [Oceanicaulis sp.]HCR66229.1 glycosyl transferase [Oceanicaulis sp.]
MSVAVLIPTYRRNDALAGAVRSVFAQTRLPDEIVIVDNDPQAGARIAVEQLSDGAPVRLSYVHEPNPGVSNARNTGFAHTQARFIAQLDDDETASPHWLASLLDARKTLDAPVVFGPVIAQLPDPLTRGVRAAYTQRLYSRLGSSDTQVIDKPHGCGNALFDREALDLPSPVFDHAANEIGGEDDMLFQRLQAQGVCFGWAAQADVYEHVQAPRQSWGKLLQRSFAYGQGPTQTCAQDAPRNWAGVVFWMGVGAAQVLVFGACAPLARLISAKAAAECLDKAAQGLGKLIWFEAVSPRLYGANA